jgi:hypothetical protein
MMRTNAPLVGMVDAESQKHCICYEYFPKSDRIPYIPCHSAQPLRAYQLPHRREIVSGAVFEEKAHFRILEILQ